MATIEGKVRVGVARKENRAEIDLEGDGLHPAVHADIPLRCNGHAYKQRKVGIDIKQGTRYIDYNSNLQ